MQICCGFRLLRWLWNVKRQLGIPDEEIFANFSLSIGVLAALAFPVLLVSGYLAPWAEATRSQAEILPYPHRLCRQRPVARGPGLSPFCRDAQRALPGRRAATAGLAPLPPGTICGRLRHPMVADAGHLPSVSTWPGSFSRPSSLSSALAVLRGMVSFSCWVRPSWQTAILDRGGCLLARSALRRCWRWACSPCAGAFLTLPCGRSGGSGAAGSAADGGGLRGLRHRL